MDSTKIKIQPKTQNQQNQTQTQQTKKFSSGSSPVEAKKQTYNQAKNSRVSLTDLTRDNKQNQIKSKFDRNKASMGSQNQLKEALSKAMQNLEDKNLKTNGRKKLQVLTLLEKFNRFY